MFGLSIVGSETPGFRSHTVGEVVVGRRRKYRGLQANHVHPAAAVAGRSILSLPLVSLLMSYRPAAHELPRRRTRDIEEPGPRSEIVFETD
jgi:hypothetical protein